MKTTIVLMVLVGFCSDVLAAPVKVPPLKLCASSSGAVLAKKKCAKSETTLDLAALQGQPGAPGATGAQGAQGPAGPAGMLTVSRCRIDAKNFADITWGWLTLDCKEGEFLFQHGIQTPDNSDFEVQEIRLRAFEGATYASGVQYVIYGSESWKADVLAVCCPVE